MQGRKDKIREFDFDSEMREQDAYAENPLANDTDSSFPSQKLVRSPKGSVQSSPKMLRASNRPSSEDLGSPEIGIENDTTSATVGIAKGRAFVQARFSDLGGVRKIFTTYKTAQFVVIEDISLAVIYRMIQLIVLIYAVMMCMYWHESGSNR